METWKATVKKKKKWCYDFNEYKEKGKKSTVEQFGDDWRGFRVTFYF